MSKNILYGADARNAIKAGMDKVADAVKQTMGAKGRNVIGDGKFGVPHITKDGVTVAEFITLEDPHEQKGCMLMKEIANKTAKISGDGTTCSCVIAQDITTKGLEAIDAGTNPMELKKGIDKAVDFVVNTLKTISKEVKLKDNKSLRQIAAVSANNDHEIGRLIASAMRKVGRDGVIHVEHNGFYETTIEVVDGMQVERGFVSPHFVTNHDHAVCEMDNPCVVLVDKEVSRFDQVQRALQLAMEAGRPLLLIADDVNGEALATLVTNKMKGNINCCAIKSPDFGRNRDTAMEDISVLTGASYMSERKAKKVELIELSDMGNCKRIVVGRDKCTFVKGDVSGNDLLERIAHLSAQIKIEKIPHVKDFLKLRRAQLQSGIAIMSVGGVTETEITEKRDRVDDAVCATRSALEEGYVPGGGSTLIHCANLMSTELVGDNEDQNTGIAIIRQALIAPYNQIAKNAGITDQKFFAEILEKGFGYGLNVRTEQVENFFETGVLDPTKVVRVALENAASIAGIFLTTECVISEKPKL